MRDETPREPRSPLKDKPLRQAGQSVEEKRQDLMFDAFGEAAIGAMMVGWAVNEWVRFWRKDQFHPWLYTIMALVAVAIIGMRLRRALLRFRQYREGRDGERIVAERLEGLRRDGFHILHDLVVSNFNIDHVAIGPSGVFAVETKTLTKRGGREEKAEFDGQAILIKGKPLPRNPIDQAAANAKWLRDFLHQSTNQCFNVVPVVILPGWYVTPKVPMRDTIVINDNPKGIQSYLVQRPQSLSADQIALINTHLGLFVRRPQS